ncbi:GNAT family N-acetyltransferase [Photobacterium sp. WH77]|uniref:GNAT family N-acetyltransferase n=1 Tax=unclassified Photobacterium TaxID=2628852 RepID=UPI001EDB98BD|nr:MULTISPECIES: GNAT family N-acetyltransferase [unclassified Photobacterium]MCG2837389.1 GNAT family N-acetyltransferase [Photobacterium sp. WH77]MCG2845041.1 GNAT family N-acetyltransferase [Photobacterium sp. WH80]
MHSPQLYIRPATLADTPALTRLMAQLGYDAEPARLEKMIYLADSDSELITVAEINDQLVAVMSLIFFDYFPSAARYARITALVVDAQHRNKGIGSELLEYARINAVERDCVCIEVTSSVTREDTHAFYVNAGFHHESFKFVLPIGSIVDR